MPRKGATALERRLSIAIQTNPRESLTTLDCRSYLMAWSSVSWPFPFSFSEGKTFVHLGVLSENNLSSE